MERSCQVYVHIGAPKTGTTYLQSVLAGNQKLLRAQGVLYPLDSERAHFRAALDLRGVAFGGHRDPQVDGSWERAAEQVRGWSGRAAIISHELLAAATEEQVRRAVESLQPMEVHVVYTARDLARQIPAMWQESVKNGQTADFARYVKRLRDQRGTGRAAKIFWRSQDPVQVLRRWSVAVPAGRVHVVTVPPVGVGSTLLWERFCGVVGVDGSVFDVDVPQSNASLGLPEAELVRRLNARLRGELSWPAYEAVVKHGLAESLLARRTTSTRAGLTAGQYDWAVQRAQEMAAGLTEAGYHVAGDLAEIVPGPRGGDPSSDNRRPDPGGVIDAAVEALAQVLVDRAAARARSPRRRIRSAASTVRRRLRR